MSGDCGMRNAECGLREVGFSIRNPKHVLSEAEGSEIRNKKGIFITFEGIDQCGKTAQAERLVRTLTHAGCEVVFTHEPGGTAISERIRAIVLDRNIAGMTGWTELLLMMASRAQHTEEVILPALHEGKVVICDRYADCTAAYQGAGRGLDADTIAALNRIATLGLIPELTILLDIPVEEAARRRRCASIPEDRMEQEDPDFHNRVRTGYLTLARLDPDRFLVVDGTQPMDRIEAQIEQRVVEKLKQVTRNT